jgi:hypothetical protein
VGNRVGIDNIGPALNVGDGTAAGRNIISGNMESGVLMGIQAHHCTIRNNYIGTDASGTMALPNRDGITLGPGSDDALVDYNLVNANTQFGILISGIPDSALVSKKHLLYGNTIAWNGVGGIALNGNATDNTIGSSLSTEYLPNQIHDNGQAGVVVAPGFGNPERNTIRDNSFFDNNSHGIRIVSGQGGIQPPELISYTDDGQGTSVILGMHALAGATVDLYAGDINQSGRQEGKEWLGSGPVDVNGFFSILISSCPCDSIVATATDVLGNTSEFSRGWGFTTSISEASGHAFNVIAYPNPFRDATTIETELLSPDEINLSVYDIQGKRVSMLNDGYLSAGVHRWIWQPGNLSDGIYHFQLIPRHGNVITGKLILIQ